VCEEKGKCEKMPENRQNVENRAKCPNSEKKGVNYEPKY
jgi:hypothetical protein